MKREIIKKMMQIGISENLAHKYLRGACVPSYKKMLRLRNEVDIPLSAWEDIEKYLQTLEQIRND